MGASKLFLVFVILVSVKISLGQVTRTCPFEGFAIKARGSDVSQGVIWEDVFKVDSGTTLTSITIGSTELPGRILFPQLDDQTDEWKVTLAPVQPEFGDLVDYHGYTGGNNQNPGEGVLIQVYNATTDQEEVYRCVIELVIDDTNNRPPEFNVSGSLEFSVTTGWEASLPLNWDKQVLITDWDLTESEPSITVTPDDGVLKFQVDRRKGPPGAEWNVLLFVNTLKEVAQTYEVTANDGVNDGKPIQVTLEVKPINDHQPKFANEQYVVVLDKMPEVGDLMDLVLQAYDPDDVRNGVVSSFEFQVDDEFVEVDRDRLRFTSVPDLAGGKHEFEVTGVQDNEDVATCTVVVHFPPPDPPQPPKFDKISYIFPMPEWPEKGAAVELPSPVGGEEVIYEIKEQSSSVIRLNGGQVEFIDNVGEEDLGGLRGNLAIVFDLRVYFLEDAGQGVFSTITVVLALPRGGGTTTVMSSSVSGCDCETECPLTTLMDSTCGTPATGTTTVCDCEGSTQPGTTSDGTGGTESRTTNGGWTGSTDVGTTTSGGTGSTDPGLTTAFTDGPGTTCQPCNCDPTTSQTPEDGTTGTGDTTPSDWTTTTPETTTSQCDSCCPVVTCPPPDDCSTGPTTSPPGSTTSGDTPQTGGSTLPDWTTAPGCDTCCPVVTCGPSDCTNPTTPEWTTAPGCDTCCPVTEPEPCECDQDCDDCSNTGLIAGLVVVTVLLAASICGGGYVFYLLRKATSLPFSTESPLKPERIIESEASTETEVFEENGYSNPNLIYDEPVSFEPPEPTSEAPVASTSVGAEPDSTESPPKKSNMKTPKEIEPDYDATPTTTMTPAEEVPRERKQSVSKVLFAQDDDVYTIDEPGAQEISDFEEASDVEVDRL